MGFVLYVFVNEVNQFGVSVWCLWCLSGWVESCGGVLWVVVWGDAMIVLEKV